MNDWGVKETHVPLAICPGHVLPLPRQPLWGPGPLALPSPPSASSSSSSWCPPSSTATGARPRRPPPGPTRAAGPCSPDPCPRAGVFTINSIGRLGNQMGQYATMYALAKANGRQAFIPAEMHGALAPIFRITLPVLHRAAASRIPWKNYHLNDWMEERYRHIPGEYVRLTGYPCSWTFYHHLRAEILQEFTLHDHVREEALAFLRRLRASGRRPRTFVGVHVRRGDYVGVMPRVWKGVVADRRYLEQALDWFRARYGSLVFVVTSNGMAWCRESSLRDVVLASNGLQGSPAKEFALLTLAGSSPWAPSGSGPPTSRVGTASTWPTSGSLPASLGIAADLGQARENSPSPRVLG
uniref:L-Fucosyltransferase n=1 Tax=Suricata suricatta TaxID=37032 RepID=A0A673VEP2_SURSU